MNAKVSLSRKDELFLINLGLKSVLASALGNPEWGTDRNGHGPVSRRGVQKWSPEQRRKFKATMKKKRKTISAASRRKLSAAMKKRWRDAKKAAAEAE
jgi:hypothetical protein